MNTMTKAQHTPGPWATDIEVETFDREILDCAVYVNHGSGKGSEICTLRHDPDEGLDVRDPEYIANAKLIAAAPDLLEACKVALDYFDDPHRLTYRDAANKARAAIARAQD